MGDRSHGQRQWRLVQRLQSFRNPGIPLLSLRGRLLFLATAAAFLVAMASYGRGWGPASGWYDDKRDGPPPPPLYQFDGTRWENNRSETESVGQQSGQGSRARDPPPVGVDSTFLFFNRVPKTGSENFVWVLKILGERNGFEHRRGPSQPRQINAAGQRGQARKLTEYPGRPTSYDRHLYFFDFARFNLTNPIWFSMVRDPIAKFESRYYYHRFGGIGMYDKLRSHNASWVQGVSRSEYKSKDIDHCVQDENDGECNFIMGQRYDLTIPYFCGQVDECQVLGSQWALDQAKRNIDLWYPVVGVLEQLEETFSILEDRFPQFFKGVTELYEKELKGSRKNHGIKYQKLSEESRSILSRKFSLEIKLYEFAKIRLEGQIMELRNKYS